MAEERERKKKDKDRRAEMGLMENRGGQENSKLGSGGKSKLSFNVSCTQYFP
jgi:hypothetical protein